MVQETITVRCRSPSTPRITRKLGAHTSPGRPSKPIRSPIRWALSTCTAHSCADAQSRRRGEPVQEQTQKRSVSFDPLDLPLTPAADPEQLAALVQVFDRTPFPSTEERHALALRLGMTSRSVQIWVSPLHDHRVTKLTIAVPEPPPDD